MPRKNSLNSLQMMTGLLDTADSAYDIGSLEWKYVAEGNRNIVFGNEATARVLRVLKESVGSFKRVDNCRYESEAEEQWEYFINVIKPLLCGSAYLLNGNLVDVPEELLVKISKNLDNIRPKFRCDRGISRAVKKAFLFPHLGMPLYRWSGPPTLCVEIKPKWGFLPTSSKVKAENEIKFKVCRFCMHQKLKFNRGAVVTLSKYCPLDLFSGCTYRIKHAIISLLHTPHSNLRILLDGSLAYGGSREGIKGTEALKGLLDTFLGGSRNDVPAEDHLAEMLTTVFLADSFGDVDCSQHVSSKCCSHMTPMCPKSLQLACNSPKRDLGCQTLQKGGILATLLTLQKMGGIDIEDIHPLYVQVSQRTENINNLTKFNSPVWMETISEVASLYHSQDLGLGALGMTDNAMTSICKFLIASTFRDCSIMITMNHCDKGKQGRRCIFDEASGKYYSYQIHLTDLDPKDARKIPDYLKLDSDIIKNYMNS